MQDLREELSSVAGWMSIACWMIVYTPQIITNYRLRSGEALSVVMLFIWAISDFCNSVGAVLGGLLPTVIIIAFYKCACDATLLAQVYYFRWARQRKNHDECAPLLAPEPPPKAPSPSPKRQALLYTLAVLFVLAVGLLAWHLHHPTTGSDTGPHPGRKGDIEDWRSQVVGWISAVLNIGSRIPQLLKNNKTKCAGLSIALFLFSVSGNFIYFCSILIESTSWIHLVVNSSWLVGSGGAVLLDCGVLTQFFYYREARERMSESTATEEVL